jgi:uncharacterized protein DUF6504
MLSNINSIFMNTACLPPGGGVGHGKDAGMRRAGRENTAVSRVYGEPIDVWIRDGRPARFVWRGRLYPVLRVLEHWVVSREWWQRQDAGHGDPADHEFWRVEASQGRSDAAATYELRREAATGTWLLARVWD